MRWSVRAVAAVAVLAGALAIGLLDARDAEEEPPSLQVAVANLRWVSNPPEGTEPAQTIFGMRLNVTNTGAGAYVLHPHDWRVHFQGAGANRPYGWQDVLHDDGRLEPGASTQYLLFVVAYAADPAITSLEFRGETVAAADDFARAASTGEFFGV